MSILFNSHHQAVLCIVANNHEKLLVAVRDLAALFHCHIAAQGNAKRLEQNDCLIEELKGYHLLTLLLTVLS